MCKLYHKFLRIARDICKFFVNLAIKPQNNILLKMGKLPKQKLFHRIICMRFFPILVFDSGIGGISTLCFLENKLKGEDFLYVADFLNSPYGNKPKKEIEKLVLSTLKKYVETFHPKSVVVACNTATAVCIKKLRKFFSIPIFGCEPAVKMAKNCGCKNILVLCTRATKKYSEFLKGFCDIKVYSPQKLAGIIDENFFDKNTINQYLQKCLMKFRKKFDCVVLGCTHYCLFKKEIENILGCKSFEGNKNIATHVKTVLKNIRNNGGTTKLISTDNLKQQYLEECYKKIKGEKICVE